jgi:hypothetical protein
MLARLHIPAVRRVLEVNGVDSRYRQVFFLRKLHEPQTVITPSTDKPMPMKKNKRTMSRYHIHDGLDSWSSIVEDQFVQKWESCETRCCVISMLTAAVVSNS